MRVRRGRPRDFPQRERKVRIPACRHHAIRKPAVLARVSPPGDGPANTVRKAAGGESPSPQLTPAGRTQGSGERRRTCMARPACAPIRDIMDKLLHFQAFGEGERAVILLHGLFGLAANLGTLARELGRDYRVLVPDLRNHGRSFHAPRMNYRSMAADVLRLMDANGIGRAAFLGHSMGGKVAMQAALDDPGRVERLLVADIAPIEYPPHHSLLLAALREIATDSGADRQRARQILETRIEEPGVVALMLMNRARREDGSWHWRFNLAAIEDDYARILAAPEPGAPYPGPVLFLKGELSEYILAGHLEHTRTLFPGARLKVIAGAGHWLHAEKPLVFLRLARDFLGGA
jgi:esterase